MEFFYQVPDVERFTGIQMELINKFIQETVLKMYKEREAVCELFLISGAFRNELSTVEYKTHYGKKAEWRIW